MTTKTTIDTTVILQPPLCSEHRTPMLWSETEFRHVEDGVEVMVRHIPAWVCPHQDDVAFPPGVTNELIRTIRRLIDVAKQAQLDHQAWPQHEYLVKILA